MLTTRSFLQDGMRSDLIIVCGDGIEIKAHKAIVCSQSGPINNLCTLGSSNEHRGNTVIIGLPNEPKLIQARVQFLYYLHSESDEAVPLYLHTGMYAMSASYKIPSLAVLASNEIDLSTRWAIPDFAAAAQLIRSNDLRYAEHSMQELCVKFCSTHLKKMYDGNLVFKEFMLKCDEFGTDVGLALTK